MTTELFSALYQCLEMTLHVELKICGLFHLSPFSIIDFMHERLHRYLKRNRKDRRERRRSRRRSKVKKKNRSITIRKKREIKQT